MLFHLNVIKDQSDIDFDLDLELYEILIPHIASPREHSSNNLHYLRLWKFSLRKADFETAPKLNNVKVGQLMLENEWWVVKKP